MGGNGLDVWQQSFLISNATFGLTSFGRGFQKEAGASEEERMERLRYAC